MFVGVRCTRRWAHKSGSPNSGASQCSRFPAPVAPGLAIRSGSSLSGKTQGISPDCRNVSRGRSQALMQSASWAICRHRRPVCRRSGHHRVPLIRTGACINRNGIVGARMKGTAGGSGSCPPSNERLCSPIGGRRVDDREAFGECLSIHYDLGSSTGDAHALRKAGCEQSQEIRRHRRQRRTLLKETTSEVRE